MAIISGLGGIAPNRPAAPRAGPGGFRVETGPAGAAPRAAAAQGVAAPSLLGLQEAQQDAVADREARRHANEALDMMREMQLALLGRAPAGADPADTLDRLARRVPDTADPALRAVQQAVLLRAAVERARHRAAASL